MKGVWGYVSTGLAVLSAGGALVGGCAHDDSTLFVLDVLEPHSTTAGQACAGFTPDPTQPFISSGVLDVGLAGAYNPIYLVGNQMVARADPTAPKTETSYVNIQGAIVRITDASGANQLNTYTRLASGTIPPASGTTPSFIPIDVTTIDNGTVMTYGPRTFGNVVRLVTYVKFFGKSLGGQYVESNEFSFPVDLCLGCLITFSAADIDRGATPQPNCALAASATTQSSGTNQQVPCIIGQDLIVDCSQCLDNILCNPPTTSIVNLDAGPG